jgi:hypothetical protein
MQFSSQNSRFLCNCLDGPLKASERPTVSRSFSFEECPDGRATPSGCYLGFQEDFCTCLSVFIITLCSSMELRWNWCRWKARKKSYNLNSWTENRNVRTAHCPDGNRVASRRLPKIWEISEFLFRHETVDRPDALYFLSGHRPEDSDFD